MKNAAKNRAKSGHFVKLAGAIALMVGLALGGAEALAASRGKAKAVHVKKGPAIDGSLDDRLWGKCQKWPMGACTKKDPLAYRTYAKVLFDDKNIYIGVYCSEPDTGSLTSSATRRDGEVWQDDSIEIFIRPNSKESYYQFAVNSIGTVSDLRIFPTGRRERGWDGKAEAKTSILPGKAWTVTLRVPLKEIEAYVGDAQTWRININRNRPARGKDPLLEYSWAILSSNSYHSPKEFGVVTGVNVPKTVGGVSRIRPGSILDVDMDPVPQIPLKKGASQAFLIHLSNGGKKCRGTVKFENLPDRLVAEPTQQKFELKSGQERLLVFQIKCADWGKPVTIRPTVSVEGDASVNFPKHLETTIVHSRKFDLPPLENGLLVYHSLGDNPTGQSGRFDKSVGYDRCWSEGFWVHSGGVKGNCFFGYNGLPWPRLRWSKLSFESWNNVDHQRGTILFWIRQPPVRTNEIEYSPRFNPDPRSTWKTGPNIGGMGGGEGLLGYHNSPIGRYNMRRLKREHLPFKPGSESFVTLRRYKKLKGVTDGYIEAMYLAMRGKRYHVQASYEYSRLWRHVAVLWDADQARLEIYLDGKKASGAVMRNGKANRDKVWYSAPWSPAVGNNATMSMVLPAAEGSVSATDRDEFYIYNRALTPKEIVANMKAAMGAVPTPMIRIGNTSFRDSIAVAVESPWAGPAHRYTLDGTEPTAESRRYEKPIVLSKSATLRVRSFMRGFTPSAVATATLTYLGPDETKPRVSSAHAVTDPRHVLVAFSEKVDAETASTAANYRVDGQAIKSAKLDPEAMTVRLELAKRLKPGEHKLSAANVRDRARKPNTMEAMKDFSFEFQELPGCTGYWNFDVVAGAVVKDLSPSRVDGRAWDDTKPGATYGKGIKGKAIYFDGKDDMFDITKYKDAARCVVDPKSPVQVRAGTYALWFKPIPDPPNDLRNAYWFDGSLINKHLSYRVTFQKDLILKSKVGYKLKRSGTKVSYNRWQHLVYTFQFDTQNGAKLYLDGKLIFTHTPKPESDHAGWGVSIGMVSGYYGPPRFLRGAIDEVMLFDRVLSAAEVESLHKTGRLGTS